MRVCGDPGRELETRRSAPPSGDAGRLVDPRDDGAVAGRFRRRELPHSPNTSALALTGPPERKAPIPAPETDCRVCEVGTALPLGMEFRTEPKQSPRFIEADCGFVLPVPIALSTEPRLERLSKRRGDSPRYKGDSARFELDFGEASRRDAVGLFAASFGSGLSPRLSPRRESRGPPE